jgi:hypothetical protein
MTIDWRLLGSGSRFQQRHLQIMKLCYGESVEGRSDVIAHIDGLAPAGKSALLAKP